ncbi:hypothetical protein FOA52_005230 [Chlamydomonas sp. UWO 241]|nr:hypothetical protein FOA52_005230 [Chlamydomonas sp. UWO 241]
MAVELRQLEADPPPGCSVWPVSDSLRQLSAQLTGPDGSVYEGGTFLIRVSIPERYPFEPPTLTFETPLLHPNIDAQGRICLDLLNMPPKGGWRPSLNISTILMSVRLLLGDPNPDDGLVQAPEFLALINLTEFSENVTKPGFMSTMLAPNDEAVKEMLSRLGYNSRQEAESDTDGRWKIREAVKLHLLPPNTDLGALWTLPFMGGGQRLPTVGDYTLTGNTNDDGSVRISGPSGDSSLYQTDIPACKGYINMIGKALLPPNV